jgi:hypothetical protein
MSALLKSRKSTPKKLIAAREGLLYDAREPWDKDKR